ncbi:MAG: valine--tRNA ligase [Anaerolineae bacterium]|nr:valine--tRNA ligase [Anaerolineae bacterium]
MPEFTMPKTYDPQATEQRLYDWWEAQGYFQPEQQIESGLADPNLPPFVITMPPPNITGALHLGHALTAALQDLMIRYHRMKGHPTLWLPGSDHASIATHAVIERGLKQRQLDNLLQEIGFPLPEGKAGLSRQDLGREWFMKLGWAWKRHYGSIITEQHRRLGASCDWRRERFTLDEGLSRAVRTAFVRLYERGLIYRGEFVNWCPTCVTAVSDLEVEYEDTTGTLWTVRYFLEGGGYIEVATTRPETILGDTAVAVHPDDERYQHLIGRTAILPVLGRRIPIIADEYVDPAFGTGAVKVTPGHDPSDYEVGKRHELPMINILNRDGTLNEEAGPYAGLDRYEARQAMVRDLEAAGQLIRRQPHTHALGHCQRCHTVVEPMLSAQWFVRIQPLAEAALQAVRNGRIRIVPERFAKIYYNWLENIRDWCISRQLWWGHRIPVWYCDDCGEQWAALEDPTACRQCRSTNIRQDEDILDTWFSSGLWPFSTLGWPDDTEDLRRFYPNSVRETGYDILFFWVAREIMLGLAMLDEVPYRLVYLHGLIRNEKGDKVSKSMPDAQKYDPLYAIEEYGADALRYALVTGSTPGMDTRLSPKRIEAARNFANKLWNAARFVISNLNGFGFEGSGFQVEPATFEPSNLELADRWILSRLSGLTANVNRLLENYQYGEAGRQIHDFLWGEYCDWFLEMAKLRLYGDDAAAKATAQQVLTYVLERTLRLLHPFMPFVTEEIWQNLMQEAGGKKQEAGDGYPPEALMVARWPEEAGLADAQAEAQMGLIMDIVHAIRNARAEYDVPPGRRIAALVSAGEQTPLLREQQAILVSLARLDEARLQIAPALEVAEKAVTLVVGGVTVHLPLAGMVDLEAERARLSGELAQTVQRIARAEALLANPGFTGHAPAEVVQRERDKLAELQAQREKLEAQLQSLTV